MELDPDLQFKHYTVAEAQLPADALARISHVSLGRGRDLLRPRPPRLQPRPHRSEVAEALRGSHWFDARASGRTGPGATGAPTPQPSAPERRRLSTLRRVPTIVIPYRGDAKRRLPPAIRAALRVAMLGDVVEAALEVGRVLVVTDDAAVVPPGAEVVADPGTGPRRGGRGRARAQSRATRSSSTPIFPLRRPRALRRARRRRARARRGARRDDERALAARSAASSLRCTGREAPRGSGRTRRSRPSRIPELEADVDTIADLERLAALLGPRTRALLAVPA